ncbi:hypothetical protein HS088_TW20G00276 [Tripterygium wilfordii]|uniref:DUF1442 family protein n=2 Tax=Tripterygium wilfordii TaxID=458696 RepID=A0A7J7C6Z8_TRIWF|nr:hypothetical protein HS088_TW20G00276 [Tripterygium wilfordii]
MAAGWNAKLVVETFTQGGVITTSIGLSIASRRTDGRHVCIVPDERSGSEYAQAMRDVGMEPEVIVGEPEKVMEGLTGIDFLVMDCRQKDFAKVLRFAKLGNRGAVLVCKHASSKNALNFRWRSVMEGCSRRVVRSVFLPVGKGLDIAHVAATGGGGGSGDGGKRASRWIKHIDRQSGEEHLIRR